MQRPRLEALLGFVHEGDSAAVPRIHRLAHEGRERQVYRVTPAGFDLAEDFLFEGCARGFVESRNRCQVFPARGRRRHEAAERRLVEAGP
jgi:DNA-binding PadR family transcriptional regulator